MSKYVRVPSLLAVFTSWKPILFSLLIPISTGSKPVFFATLLIWSSQGIVASRFMPLNSGVEFIAIYVRTCLEEQLCDTLTVLALVGHQGEGLWKPPFSIYLCWAKSLTAYWLNAVLALSHLFHVWSIPLSHNGQHYWCPTWPLGGHIGLLASFIVLFSDWWVPFLILMCGVVVVCAVVLSAVHQANVGLPHILQTEKVFAHMPTSRASNFVNFKFNPYFMFVSSTYCVIKGTYLLPCWTSATYDSPRSLLGIDYFLGTYSISACCLFPNSFWVVSSFNVLPDGGSFRVAAIVSVCSSMVTGVGGIPVTCLLLVFHLLPVRALYTLEMNLWLLSMWSSLPADPGTQNTCHQTILILLPPM